MRPLATLALIAIGGLTPSSNHDCPAYPSSRWSFNPEVLEARADLQNQMTMKFGDLTAAAGEFAAPPRRNFIDDHIFSRLDAERVPSADLATDAEFMRRVTIDLTGRPPEVDRLLAFLADGSTNKRARYVDELLQSEAFTDRWAFFVGELIKNTTAYGTITVAGRNALHAHIRASIANDRPYSALVSDLIRGAGDSLTSGPANYVLRSYSLADPIHDTWDDLTSNTMSAFLGIQSLCVSCHDGARHLEAINTYLAQRKRREFWQTSAFFSRMTINRIPLDTTGRMTQYEVLDKASGAYYAQTRGNAGQRPLRTGGPYTPAYMLTGETPKSEDWRAEFARILTSDIQFARASVNRVWAHMMGVGIVDPPDGFDPASYATQASHPQLLDALARDFQQSNFSLRHMIRTIANSSTYQLSVRYPAGQWNEAYRRLFARRLVRPLDAEEIHDSVIQATGLRTLYAVDGFDKPIVWAMQSPDTNEPRRSESVTFMSVFGRGNRVDLTRNPDSSILGSLSLMNGSFVINRITAQGNTAIARILQLQIPDDALVDQIFLQTLSRYPTAAEKASALQLRSRNRTEWAEDLQWSLVNKLDFTFNY